MSSDQSINLTESAFDSLRNLIKSEAGITLGDSKSHLMKSRLIRRLSQIGVSTFDDYYNRLQSDPTELREFINALTTNKTDFFREQHHFTFLRDTYLPDLKAKAKSGQIPRRLRIWHAGCSTGEEPYTMGVVLSECFPETGWDIKQLASDIDTEVLMKAKAGIYEEEKLNPVPQDLRQRYFSRGMPPNQNHFVAKDSLRERIIYRQINLVGPIWPIREDVRFDIVFCRNVMIYFDRSTQINLTNRLMRKLKPGGILFLGHSETLMVSNNSFKSVTHTGYQLIPSNQMEAA